MSYTTTIKNEITEIVEEKSEEIATLSGFIRNNAEVGSQKIVMTTENSDIKDKIISYIESLYEVKPIVSIVANLNFNKRDLYLIEINEREDFILKDIGYLDDNGNYLVSPPDYIVGGNEEIRAYLRGVFLSQGSINDPKTSRYHLELVIDKPEEAVFVQKLLNIFDLNAKMLNRSNRYMIYIKEAEKISDFIKILGAVKAVLYFENVRIYHDKKNHTNRLNNCEQANTDKVIGAATKLLNNIEILEENLAVDLLDDRTKEALEYRKKYPDASLKELSEIISIETGNKLTKSGLNHRLRKINELAEKMANLEK